jgi:hypothetical protein
MRIWWPLLLAPVLALADQSIAYATAGWACANQQPVAIHALHAFFLAGCIAGIAMGLGQWRQPPAGGTDERERVRHFLAGIGVASATLAAGVIAAMWIGASLLSPCVA